MSLVGMPGYQETPAGWIPANWSALHLGAVASVRKDKGVAKQGIPCVELEHIEPETGRLLGWDSSGTQASIKTSFKQGVDIEKFLFKPKDWLKKLVPLPPVAEQARIADVLATADEKLNALRAKQVELQQVKRGLMQKLLTGEWRVSVDASAAET